MTYEVTLTELASTVTCHQRVRTTAAEIADNVGRGLGELHEFATASSVNGCRKMVNGVAVVVRGPRERVVIGVQTSGERRHGAERLVP